MKYVQLLFAGLALALAGCAALDPPAKAVKVRHVDVAPSAAHVVCERPAQEGCITLRVYNLAWDPGNPLTVGLDKLWTTKEERQDRVQNLPPRLQRAYREGKVRASQPRYFLLYVFRGNSVPAGNLSGYQYQGGKPTTRVALEDFTYRVKYPVFDPTLNLGPPTRVYRVRVGDVEPGVVEIVFPRSILTADTYLLTCPGDLLTVYPPAPKRDGGHWVSNESISWLIGKGSKLWLQAFLSETCC